MKKTLQEKISELESQGWTYEHELRLHVKDNVFVQVMALTKDGQCRVIKNGKIGRIEPIQ